MCLICNKNQAAIIFNIVAKSHFVAHIVCVGVYKKSKDFPGTVDDDKI